MINANVNDLKTKAINTEELETGEFFGEIFDFNTDEAFDNALEQIGLHKFFDYDAKDKIVADIGCGYGRSTCEFWKAGAKQVLAVDYSLKQLERTRKNLKRHGYHDDNISFLHLSATNLEGINDNIM